MNKREGFFLSFLVFMCITIIFIVTGDYLHKKKRQRKVKEKKIVSILGISEFLYKFFIKSYKSNILQILA